MGASPSTRSSGPPPIELRDYWQALRLRWFWVVTGAVVGAALGWTAGAAGPSNYEASTSVLLSALTADPLAQLDQRNAVDMSTERQIAESRQVAERTLIELGDPEGATVEELLADLSVVVAEDTRVLRFTYVSKDAEIAAKSANAFAAAYLENRRGRSAQIVGRVRDSTQQRLQQLDESLAQTEEELSELDEDDPDSADAIREIEARFFALSTQQALAQAELFELPSGGIDGGSVISPAVTPSEPSNLSPSLLALLGLLFGTIAGVVIALFLRSIDPWARDGERVNEVLGLPPVGFIPDPDPRRRKPLGPRAVPGSLHRIAQTIDVLLGDGRPRIVVLLDAGGDVAQDVARPIAAGMAQRQRTVVVVGEQRRDDVDLTTVFQRLERGPRASTSIPEWVERTQGGRPDVVDLSSVDAPDSYVEAIAELIDQYDIVVVPVPMVDESTTALNVTFFRHASLVPIVRLGSARLEELRLLRRDLEATGASVLGTIIVGPRMAWGRTDLPPPVEPHAPGTVPA